MDWTPILRQNDTYITNICKKIDMWQNGFSWYSCEKEIPFIYPCFRDWHMIKYTHSLDSGITWCCCIHILAEYFPGFRGKLHESVKCLVHITIWPCRAGIVGRLLNLLEQCPHIESVCVSPARYFCKDQLVIVIPKISKWEKKIVVFVFRFSMSVHNKKFFVRMLWLLYVLVHLILYTLQIEYTSTHMSIKKLMKLRWDLTVWWTVRPKSKNTILLWITCHVLP